jgi:hypothetical protein
MQMSAGSRSIYCKKIRKFLEKDIDKTGGRRYNLAIHSKGAVGKKPMAHFLFARKAAKLKNCGSTGKCILIRGAAVDRNTKK